MSKSIKQYKDAMDNIRTSESFLKRTESLLKELPENETVTVSSKRPQNLRHIILAAGLGAAACITAAVTLSPALVKDDIAADSIVTEVTSVTEVTAPNETVYIDIERDGQIIIPAADAELLEKESPDEAGAQTETDVAVTVTESNVVTESNNVTEKTVTESQTVTQGEKPVTEEIKTNADTAPAQENADEEPVEAEPRFLYLYDIDFSNAEVELVAYIISSSGASTAVGNESGSSEEEDDEAAEEAAPSEKSTEMVILDAEAAEKLVTTIGNVIYSSETTSDGRYSPVLFAVSINNIATGNKAFDITLNENGTVTLTVFTNTGSFADTYAPAEEKFARLERAMFLYFGNADEYESYIAAKSGK